MSEQQKWRVLWDGRNWSVLDPKYGWSVHPWTFDAWTDAIHFADQQARTITVTLPRLAPGEWATVGNFCATPEPPWLGDALEVAELGRDGAYFIVGKEDCEPLALALLAHARRRA